MSMSPKTSSDAAPERRMIIERLATCAVMFLFFAYFAWAARDFGQLSRVLPAVVGIGGMAMAAVYFVQQVLQLRAASTPASTSDRDEGVGATDAGEPTPAAGGDAGTSSMEGASLSSTNGTGRYVLWLIAFILGFAFVGPLTSMAAFLALFLRFEAKFTWVRSLVYGAVVLGVVLLVGTLYPIAKPDALLP